MDSRGFLQIDRYVAASRSLTCPRLTKAQGPRMLGYDLDLLYDYVQRRGTKKLVLALRDSEAFDPALLTDLLSLFKYERRSYRLEFIS